jgi:hypothetical protein
MKRTMAGIARRERGPGKCRVRWWMRKLKKNIRFYNRLLRQHVNQIRGLLRIFGVRHLVMKYVSIFCMRLYDVLCSH